MIIDTWPMILLGLRIAVAIVLYLFLFTALRGLRAELRARTTPSSRPVAAPMPARVAAVAPRFEDRLEVIDVDGDEAERSTLIGRSYRLDGPALIGRAASSTIVLPERHVSSRHARLLPDGGAWWVEDLDSTNGTYVGEHRIEGRTRLDASGEVRFGPVVARLVRSGR